MAVPTQEKEDGQAHQVAAGLTSSQEGPMTAAIRRLADEAGKGIYLYRTFDEAPTFYSYRQLYQHVAGCMERFRAQGVCQGSRVLLPFDTSIEVIGSFLALIGMGALTFSVKPLDVRAGQDARSYLETVCQRYRISHAIRASKSGVTNLSVHELDPSGAFAEDAAFAPAAADDLAFVQFSSGSTSSPKGIPVTRGALEKHLQLLTDFDQRTQDDVYVSWLPLYHDLGLILGLLTSIYARNDLHLIAPFQFIRDPVGWLDLLSIRRATHAATPYFAVNYCLNYLERNDDADASQDWNFKSLRSFLIGSDPTDFDRTIAFQQRLEPYGFQRRALLPAYGMAEAVLVVSATRIIDEPWAHALPDGRKFVSTGRLLPGFEARITREDGTLCEEGELGQIELRGGTMARGYFEEPAISFYNDSGYFETGDLAYLVRGELVIAGRAGDRVKINGQTLFSSDFEFAVQSLPFIKHDRVVVFQIDYRTIVLAQVANSDALLTPDEHKTAVSTAIAQRLGVKIPPEDIHFIATGQIQKTSSGKIKRRAMAQAFIDGTIRFATLVRDASGTVPTSVGIPTNTTPDQEVYLAQ